MFPSREYSEETAMEIDKEVKQIVTEIYQKVKATLDGKKDILEKVAGVLLEKELIEGEELRRLVASA
jgi:cell division protease FtsH